MFRLVEVATDAERARFAALGGPPPPGADALLLLEGADGPAARCALWWTATPTHDGKRVGAIGHYSAADAPAGVRLLVSSCEKLAEHGCGMAVGPLDGNTWRRYRLVTERGSEPPFFLEPDNPDDWPDHFARAGFTPLAHYHSALTTDLDRDDPRAGRAADRFLGRGGHIRTLDVGRFEDEIDRIHALSLASFRDNVLFTPLGLGEFRAQCHALRSVLRPELVLLAEREGRLLGYVFAVPDVLQARRGQAVDTVVIKTLAVHPDAAAAGLGSVLADRCHRAVRQLGYRRAVHALMRDSSPSARISRRTATVMRRYALFAQPLGRGEA